MVRRRHRNLHPPQRPFQTRRHPNFLPTHPCLHFRPTRSRNPHLPTSFRNGPTDTILHAFNSHKPQISSAQYHQDGMSVQRRSRILSRRNRRDHSRRCSMVLYAPYARVREDRRSVVFLLPFPIINHDRTNTHRSKGLCCFYNEKVTIELDGEILDSPITPFSNRKPNDKPNFL